MVEIQAYGISGSVRVAIYSTTFGCNAQLGALFASVNAKNATCN